MENELDRYSTNAMHWAEQLVKTANENNFDREEILDAGWLAVWFANYWAAINDPLQKKIDELTEEVRRLQPFRKTGEDLVKETAFRCAKIADSAWRTNQAVHNIKKEFHL